ncbi:MAG: hypothetical protein EPN86_03375 [Nanoarchaeota archaeon]|nr:MAG: hypothetical protein EPN86_03375 [Nanoarchaeota archaeon]
MNLTTRTAIALNFLREAAKHPSSMTLIENALSGYAGRGKNEEIAAQAVYKRIVPEYEMARANPQRCDFGDSPNHGWKVHLNVEVQNVQAVSDFLKGQGYYHKYLEGGDIADGKVFTLYLGSFAKAQSEAATISESLEGRLAKPVNHDEVELARGVVGRFRTERFGFNPYGTSGLSTLSTSISLPYLLATNATAEEIATALAKAEEASCKRLLHHFGDYFFPERITVGLPS